MDYSVANTLTLYFDGDEVGTFLSILHKLNDEKKRAGFRKKLLDKEENELIRDMYVKIVGDEENTN